MRAAYHIASNEFADTSRKGGDIPYISHLLAVSALVIENGGTEEQAAAALLHDIIEDRNIADHHLSQRLIEAGATSAAAETIVTIVTGTSDGRLGQERSASTWRERKTNYHESLAKKTVGDPSILVSLADKVHNLESTLAQVRSGLSPDEIFDHFHVGTSDQKWNYESLLAIFTEHAKYCPELAGLVTRLRFAFIEVFSR